LLVYYTEFFKANPWPALILGGIISIIVSLPLGAICFRLRGVYFAFATLAVSEIVRLIVANTEFTHGGLGVLIPVAPSIQLGNFVIDFRDKLVFYYISLFLLLICFGATHLMVKLRIGFKLLIIREDEDAAISIGVNSFKLKIFAMMMSSFFAGVVGALYAQYISYIDPSHQPGGVLATATGLDIIIVTMLGGAGTIMGPLIGSLIRYPLREFLRVTFGFSAGLDLLTFGVVLILVIIIFPGGMEIYFRENFKDGKIHCCLRLTA